MSYLLPALYIRCCSLYRLGRGLFYFAPTPPVYRLSQIIAMSSAATYTTFHEGLRSPDVKVSTKIHSPATNLPPKPLPYWLVNVPRSQWTAECPSYLRDTSQKNIEVLSTPDEQYRRQGWELVKEIVRMFDRMKPCVRGRTWSVSGPLIHDGQGPTRSIGFSAFPAI